MDDFISISEAAEKIGASVALIRRWCQTGKMPAVKVGKTWIIKASDVEKHPPVGEWAKGRPKK
ncbi:hypothetical protein hrd7_25260 [Leptolinea sp. HRD-7]|nr:hypothetical protein hrd7_25260 [Leptolinea sp. HRD-7]